MTYADIKRAVDHKLYKELSTANQIDEACRKTEAIWSNARIDDLLDYDRAETPAAVFKAKTEIERSILDLIIQRDTK